MKPTLEMADAMAEQQTTCLYVTRLPVSIVGEQSGRRDDKITSFFGGIAATPEFWIEHMCMIRTRGVQTERTVAAAPRGPWWSWLRLANWKARAVPVETKEWCTLTPSRLLQAREAVQVDAALPRCG